MANRIKIKKGEIVDYLEKLKPKIDKVIEKYLPRKITKKWLDLAFGKSRYSFDLKAAQGALSKPIWNFLNRGGKRWRPVLFLLVTEAIGGDIKKVKDFVVIPELIHNGCLTEDSYVLKNPGEQVKITDIKKGDYVYTLTSDAKLSKNKVLALKFNGIKKVYKLKTRNREIKASENHPFLVITKEQSKRYKITLAGREKINKKLKRGDIKKISNSLKRSLRILYNALYPNCPQLLEPSEFKFIFNWLGLKLESSDYIIKQTKFESPEIKLVWKQLKSINPGDKIIILNKIPNEGKPMELPEPPKNPIKDKTKMPRETTEEFCQLVGYILGDGSISIDKKSSRIQLCPSNDEEEISAYSSLFSKVFSYKLKKHKGSSNLYCGSFKVCWLLDKLGLHKKATEKTIPEWIFTLPMKQKLAFVNGYLDSDGWVGKNGTTYFSSSNKILIEKLKLLLDSLGFTTSHIFYKRIKNLWKISKKKYSDQWSISLSNPNLVLEKIGTEKTFYKKRLEIKKKGKTFRIMQEFPYLPIEFPSFRVDRVIDIKPLGEEPVYDLMVENSHNFIANNILVHNSIIVDDLEDDSQFRRGKPCLHRIFGVDIAMNAGNFLYFLPLLALIKNRKKFKSQVLLRAYETYIQEMINISFGQATDIFWHKGKVKEINEEQYLQMCAFKTGCLSRMAAKLAVVLSGRSEQLAEKIGRVAEAIGVAFQIQDDILNLTGEKFAKRKGGLGEDITEGKRSLMVIYTLKKANKKDRKRLFEILDLHTKNQKLRNEAINIIKKYNSIECAKEKAKSLVKDAWQDADKLLKPSKAKERLNEFVNYLIEREI